MTRRLLPHEVKDAVIQVCGRAFWYKQPLLDTFARAGIPEDIYLKYEHEVKFKMARYVIGELEQLGDEGYLLQRRLLNELCKFRNLPDAGVPDKDGGLGSLRRLKSAVQKHDLEFKEERQQTARRAGDAEELVQKARERERRLSELNRAFQELSTSDAAQSRGYSLEDLLKELFALYEIPLQEVLQG